MKTAEMRSAAKALVAFGTGIPAAGESLPTINAPFAAYRIESSHFAANVAEAQSASVERARLNAFARIGLYDREMERIQQSWFAAE